MNVVKQSSKCSIVFFMLCTLQRVSTNKYFVPRCSYWQIIRTLLLLIKVSVSKWLCQVRQPLSGRAVAACTGDVMVCVWSNLQRWWFCFIKTPSHPSSRTTGSRLPQLVLLHFLCNLSISTCPHFNSEWHSNGITPFDLCGGIVCQSQLCPNEWQWVEEGAEDSFALL